jgi:hypothetical protein
MLVISPSVVIAPGTTIPPGTPLIGWHNLVTRGNVSATSEDPSYPATNLANPATNLEWRATVVDQVYLHAELNTLLLVNYVAVARHNFGSAQIPVQPGYFNEALEWNPLAPEQVPPDDAPLLFVFDEPQSLATVKMKLNPGIAAPRAAVWYVGVLLALERGVDVGTDFPVPLDARKTSVVNGRSEAGDFLGRQVTSQFLEWNAAFKHFTPAWYRTYMRPFVRAAQRDVPFFYTWAPDDYPYEVTFAWLRDDPIPLTNPATGRVGVDLVCGGIVE